MLTAKYAYMQICKYFESIGRLNYIVHGASWEWCTFLAAALWLAEFLYSIMGNVVFIALVNMVTLQMLN